MATAPTSPASLNVGGQSYTLQDLMNMVNGTGGTTAASPVPNVGGTGGLITAPVGGNENQIQVGQQAGAFGTTGTQAQQQSGTQATTGATTGQTTTGVNDTLGMGQLLIKM